MKDCDIIKIYEYTIRSYNSFLRILSNNHKTAENKYSKNYYSFIPLPHFRDLIQDFYETYRKLRKKTKAPTFIDIGCGCGNILVLAQSIGYKIYGIDNDPKCINIARKLCFAGLPTYSERIFRGNILNYNGYEKYDVLYYYVPIKEIRLMLKAAKRIHNQMKVGAIIYPVQFYGLFRSSEKFKSIGKYGYKKIKE